MSRNNILWIIAIGVLAILFFFLIGCTYTAPRPESLGLVSERERSEWLENNQHRESPKVWEAVRDGRVEVGMQVEHAYIAWSKHRPLRTRIGPGNGPAYTIHEFKTVGPGKPFRQIVVYEGVVVSYDY